MWNSFNQVRDLNRVQNVKTHWNKAVCVCLKRMAEPLRVCECLFKRMAEPLRVCVGVCLFKRMAELLRVSSRSDVNGNQ